MLQVGEKVKRRLKIWDPDRKAGGKPTEITVEATVVYIHPERRYYVLRFDIAPGRCFREAFQFT